MATDKKTLESYRRSFLQFGLLATAGTGVAIAVPGVLRMITGDKEAENGSGYTVMTVADVLKQAPNYKQDLLDPNTKAVFGPQFNLSPEDQVVLLPAPKNNQSMIIELNGVSIGDATKKKGIPVTYALQIQARSETDSNWILQDPLNNNSPLVVKENSADRMFVPLIPASAERITNEDNVDTRGFAFLPVVTGSLPVLIPMITTDQNIMFYCATKSIWEANNYPDMDMSRQVRVLFGNLTHPASDEVK